MVNDPDGRFKKNIHKAVPELFGGTRYIGAGYFTQRYGGRSSFSFRVAVPENGGTRDILKTLWDAVHKEIAAMSGEQYFSGEELDRAKREIYNQDILSRETPGELMSNLSFWWASTSASYYRDYLENIQTVSIKDIKAYVKKYLIEEPAVFSIWINSQDNERLGLSKEPEQIIHPGEK
jgi:predicted Zn-dependent peptidase